MGILTKQDYCPVLINEDDMASNVDFRPPSQQSVKAYVDSMIFYKSVKGLNDYNNKIYLEDWESSEIIKYFDFNGCNIKKTIFKDEKFIQIGLYVTPPSEIPYLIIWESSIDGSGYNSLSDITEEVSPLGFIKSAQSKDGSIYIIKKTPDTVTTKTVHIYNITSLIKENLP